MTSALLSSRANAVVIDRLGIACFSLDQSLSFTTYNRHFALLVGLKEAEESRITFVETFPLDLEANAFKEIVRMFNSPQELIFDDFSMTFKRWFRYRLTSDSEHVFGSIEDMTHSHESRAPGEINDDEMSAIVSCAGMGVARLRLDGRWDFVNCRAQEILGYTQAELIGKRFDEFCRRDLAELESSFVRLIKGEASCFAAEIGMTTSAGTNLWIHVGVSLIRKSNGAPHAFSIIFHDIGARKASDDSLKFALEAARMGEWDYDATEDNTHRSKRFDEILGIASGQKGWTFHDFLEHTHHDDRGILAEAFRNAITGGEDLNIEIRGQGLVDEPRWISLRGKAYMNQQGRVVRIAGLVADVTDKKSIALNLDKAKVAAEEASREKSFFLANMSHEIRTPLGAILGFADVLRNKDLGFAARLRYLEIVTRNGHCLAALIDDILDLSKVESGHLEIVRSHVHFQEILSDVVNSLRVKSDAKALELAVEISPDVPSFVLVDQVRLRQILINLLGNAIKFTPMGTVAINVRPSEFSDGQFSIRVCDTGTGLSDEQAARLFQPFVQADNSTSRQYGGTGLGLALSQRIARAMGGDLVLESSTPGRGSIFRLSIPLEAVAAMPDTLSAPEALSLLGTDLHGLKALLADDSMDNQELIKLILDQCGVDTTFADDGVIAVDRALAGDFDVILMDMQMPRLDGFGATRALREAGFKQPIVALTANAMREDRERCLAAGCTEYLAKPINPKLLRETLAAIAGRT